jgi:hypothetical protein
MRASVGMRLTPQYCLRQRYPAGGMLMIYNNWTKKSSRAPIDNNNKNYKRITILLGNAEQRY